MHALFARGEVVDALVAVGGGAGRSSFDGGGRSSPLGCCPGLFVVAVGGCCCCQLRCRGLIVVCGRSRLWRWLVGVGMHVDRRLVSLCPLVVGGGWWLLWAHRRLVVVVPVYSRGWLVVVVPVCSCGRLVVIVGSCVIVRSSWSWAIVAVRVRGQSLIVVVGGRYGRSLLFVVLPHWW